MTPADRFARLPDLLSRRPDPQRRGRCDGRLPRRCRRAAVLPRPRERRAGRLRARHAADALLGLHHTRRRGGLDAALAAMPGPGWHDLFAPHQARAASMEGDFRPLLQHLQFFKDLLALPRRLPRGPDVAPDARSHGRPLSRLQIDGVDHRIYFEEAGPKEGAAFRWFACTPPAPTGGSTGTAGRSRDHLAFSRARLRHAVARQVDAA